MARLGTRCLSAVSAYDNAIRSLQELEDAQSKFDDILNSSSLEVACEKVRSLAKAKELDSSLILLINRTWAAAKGSKTMKSEVTDCQHLLKRIIRLITIKLQCYFPHRRRGGGIVFQFFLGC